MIKNKSKKMKRVSSEKSSKNIINTNNDSKKEDDWLHLKVTETDEKI